MEQIQTKRKAIWQRYFDGLYDLQQQGKILLPHIPAYATNNGHLFYLVCNSLEERTRLIQHLRVNDIHAVFHYLSLHQSPFYASKHGNRPLSNCERFADCLLRLPLYFELEEAQQMRIVGCVWEFFG